MGSTPGEFSVDVPVIFFDELEWLENPVNCGDLVTLMNDTSASPEEIFTWYRGAFPIQTGLETSIQIGPIAVSDVGDYHVEAELSPICGSIVYDSETESLSLVDPDDPLCTAGAPAVVEVSSLAAHNGQGEIPLLMDSTLAEVLTEPRGPGLKKIVIRFNQAMDESTVENLDNYTLYDETAQETVSLASGVTATLTGGVELTLAFDAALTNLHCYTLSLGSGITDTDNPPNSLTGFTAFQLRAADGDANQDGVIDPLDTGFVLARVGQAVTSLNASADVNADGVIDPLDSGYVLARLGGSASCP